MKRFKFLAVLSVTTLLLGITGCKKESSINILELEQSLVGVWWDEFEYEDVTEDGVPFSRVLLAVKADADHTGCIYMGVFDGNNDYPLKVYGGPADAGFTWKLLGDGSLELGAHTASKSIAITDVSGISMTYTDNALTMNSGTYSGTLTKADAEEQADIEDKVSGEVRPLSTATASDYGKVVCDKGHLHPAKTAVPDGCTAVGILGKVSSTGHGLILALDDAKERSVDAITSSVWATAHYADTYLKVIPNKNTRGPLPSYTKLGKTPVSNWAVAFKAEYEAIFTNLGSTTGDGNGKTYDSNVNAYITMGVGGKELAGTYWSTSSYSVPWYWAFSDKSWIYIGNSYMQKIRPVLGF